ncbi:hypothetical protein NDU88_003388, partial [Pleurodeles waltl]
EGARRRCLGILCGARSHRSIPGGSRREPTWLKWARKPGRIKYLYTRGKKAGKDLQPEVFRWTQDFLSE